MAEAPDPGRKSVTLTPSRKVLQAIRAAELAEWVERYGEPSPEAVAWAELALGVPGTGQASSR
jgi:hypothetical protein